MNLNVEIKSIVTVTWRMKGTNNDVTNSKLLYALENQNTTTVHAYGGMIHTLGIWSKI